MLRMKCPHCEGKARVRTSREVSSITTELQLQCQGAIECGHTYVAHLIVSHTVRPSGTPNPKIAIAFSPRTRHAPPAEVPLPANDPVEDEVLAEG
jgi:hypothetical protein